MKTFLLPETEVHADGEGPAVAVEARKIQVTLGITGIVEQQSLDVSIHGSADGSSWTPKPLAAYPQKFYKGVSVLLIDLEPTPEIAFLQARWKVNRWGRGDLTPSFRFYVFAETANL